MALGAPTVALLERVHWTPPWSSEGVENLRHRSVKKVYGSYQNFSYEWVKKFHVEEAAKRIVTRHPALANF